MEVLRVLLETGKGCNLMDLAASLKNRIDLQPVVEDLERLKIVSVSYQGRGYKEWNILEEVSPLIQLELGVAPKERKAGVPKEAPPRTVQVEEG